MGRPTRLRGLSPGNAGGRAGPEAASDLFLDRYRRLIFAAIRHYAQDHDDVMDVFARACEALREDGNVGGTQFDLWVATRSKLKDPD